MVSGVVMTATRWRRLLQCSQWKTSIEYTRCSGSAHETRRGPGWLAPAEVSGADATRTLEIEIEKGKDCNLNHALAVE